MTSPDHLIPTPSVESNRQQRRHHSAANALWLATALRDFSLLIPEDC